MEFAMNLQLQTFSGCHSKVNMASYLRKGHNIMNCSAKFEKFYPVAQACQVI